MGDEYWISFDNINDLESVLNALKKSGCRVEVKEKSLYIYDSKNIDDMYGLGVTQESDKDLYVLINHDGYGSKEMRKALQGKEITIHDAYDEVIDLKEMT